MKTVLVRLTAKQQVDIDRAIRYHLDRGTWSDGYHATYYAILDTLKTPVPESRSGLTEEQRKLITRASRANVSTLGLTPDEYVPRLDEALTAFNAPGEPCADCKDHEASAMLADALLGDRENEIQLLKQQLANAKKPCGECEGLLAKVRELQEHVITLCFEHGQQLATAKAGRTTHEANVLAAGKLLAEAKAANVEMWKKHNRQRSTLAFVRARKKDIIKALYRQKQWRKELEKRLAASRARAEYASLEGRCDTLADGYVRLSSENANLETALAEARAECKWLRDVDSCQLAMAKAELATLKIERDSWKETAEILGNTKDMEAIKKSLTDIKAERVQDAGEVFAELEAEPLLTTADHLWVAAAFEVWINATGNVARRRRRTIRAADVTAKLRKLTQRAEAETEQEKKMPDEQTDGAETGQDIPIPECQEDDMPVIDHEVEVIAAIASALSGVDALAKKRILRYFAHRNGLLYYDSPILVKTRVESPDAR